MGRTVLTMADATVQSPFEQYITFAIILAVGAGLIIFFIKMMISDFKKGLDDVGAKIDKSDEKLDGRITKMECKHQEEITKIKQEVSDIKGDFATSFVLREDFFRTMNSMEDKWKQMDNKLDKLLMK